MTIEERIYSLVATNSAFQATGATLYSLQAPQGVALPYAVFFMVTLGGVKFDTHDTPNLNLRSWRFQFSAFGASYSDVAPIMAVIQAALLINQDPSGQISGIRLVDERALFEPETKTYHKLIDIEVIGKWQ